MPNRPCDASPLSPDHVAGVDECALNCAQAGWGTVAECRRCAVGEQIAACSLSGFDLDEVFGAVRSMALSAGVELYAQDATADAVYVIRGGVIKLLMRGRCEGARVARLLGRGSATGLEALTHGFYRHTAITVRESRLCRVPLDVFDLLEARGIHLADQLVAKWEAEGGFAECGLAAVSVGTIAQRVRSLLGLLADLEGQSGRTVHLPPIEGLASILGVSSRSIGRVIGGLERSKKLKRIAPNIYECNDEALCW